MKSILAALLLISTVSVAQEIRLREVAKGLEMPVGIAHAHDSRLFITTQRGRIFVFDGTKLLPEPFLDIRPQVLCCGEAGLLGLAFHPRFNENGLFYVDYVDFNGDIVIARYEISSDPDIADESSGIILLTIPHREFGNHYSGQLVFGPDNYLYVGTGDGDSAGDPLGNAQNLQSLLGKILRLDVDHDFPYAIPPSNPFIGQSAARPEIWAYGLRNPWRFSFDRESGDLWIADVGQGLWEEINLQPATSGGGENYGWPLMEGLHCYEPHTDCDEPSITFPIFEYGHDGGTCSITGGYRYRGSRYPRLRGVYIYGDFCSGLIWGAVQLPEGTWSSRLLLDARFPISSFGEDAEGELYVVGYEGRILRIEDSVASVRRRAVGR